MGEGLCRHGETGCRDVIKCWSCGLGWAGRVLSLRNPVARYLVVHFAGREGTIRLNRYVSSLAGGGTYLPSPRYVPPHPPRVRTGPPSLEFSEGLGCRVHWQTAGCQCQCHTRWIAVAVSDTPESENGPALPQIPVALETAEKVLGYLGTWVQGSSFPVYFGTSSCLHLLNKRRDKGKRPNPSILTEKNSFDSRAHSMYGRCRCSLYDSAYLGRPFSLPRFRLQANLVVKCKNKCANALIPFRRQASG